MLMIFSSMCVCGCVRPWCVRVHSCMHTGVCEGACLYLFVCACICVNHGSPIIVLCYIKQCILNMHKGAVDHFKSMCLLKYFSCTRKWDFFHGNQDFFNFTFDYIWYVRVYHE